MKGRMFSKPVKPRSPVIQLQTYQDQTGCSTRCNSMNKEFGEIVVSHGVIHSDSDLYRELKNQESLVKQAVLLIKFQNILPPQASALVVLMDFSGADIQKDKHKTIFELAQNVIRAHCWHVLEKPTRRMT